MALTDPTATEIPDASDIESRNATERAILDAARQAVAEVPYEKLTMGEIARRAFVSRTAVYFYFDDKRALIDRLIQRAFQDMYEGASAYLDGQGDPRRELRLAISRTVATVNENAHVLLLAARLLGEHEDRMPPEFAPYVSRFVTSATRRIARDQQRGIAPTDIPPRLSAAALLAMVESHITREVVVGGGDVNESIRVLAELWWRAVYSRPEDIALRTDEA